MTPLQDLGVAGAGFAVGVINTIAGAGSLLSFPVLLATGISPLAANVTNTVGVFPATMSGSYAQRSQLDGEGDRLVALGWPMGVGSAIGTALLLTLPSGFFNQVIPVLVTVACLLVLAQPLVARRRVGEHVERMRTARAAVFVLGIYGGYFGAAISILLIGVLGLLIPVPLRRINAMKTVLSGVSSGVAGIVFAVLGPVHWFLALLLGGSSLIGGPVGARLALRIPAGPLRILIAVIGLGVAAHLAGSAY